MDLDELTRGQLMIRFGAIEPVWSRRYTAVAKPSAGFEDVSAQSACPAWECYGAYIGGGGTTLKPS